MKKRRRTGLQKESILMLAASVFVLTALTMTGIYVKEKNEDNSDGYVVDFSKIESKEQNDVAKATPTKVAEEIKITEIANNDLDVDPGYYEANSGNVEIPGVTTPLQEEKLPEEKEIEAEEKEDKEDISSNEKKEEEKKESTETSATPTAKQYSFGKEDTLTWPIVGNVLLNYSMDKTIYFPTLDQYKYNPSLVIAAVEGEPIVAAAEGKISSVFTNEEIGNGMVIEIGDGYEITYGQLKDITVKEGESVKEGQIVGYVNAPTKYYSVEGTNVYFKLTKDGQAVNPMAKLQ